MKQRIFLTLAVMLAILISLGCTQDSDKVSTSDSAGIPKPSSSDGPKDIADRPIQEPTPEVLETKISPEMLVRHNNENDCWVAYESIVYDITDYLGIHPGGKDKLVEVCGTSSEFEQAFTGKHGTSKVETLRKSAQVKGVLG